MTSALFLDRDGVINVKAPEGRYITKPDDFRFLPGVVDALAEIRARAPLVRIVVVTNQRGVATGEMALADVEEIHDTMRAALRRAAADVNAVFVCPHEIGTCDCRKPGIGLFEHAIARWPEIDRRAAVVVGDSANDLLAGTRFGARTCLVGAPDRRAHVREVAKAIGARIDSEADSLADLVATGPLVRWLISGRENAKGAQ